jgi:hypothetical protein
MTQTNQLEKRVGLALLHPLCNIALRAILYITGRYLHYDHTCNCFGVNQRADRNPIHLTRFEWFIASQNKMGLYLDYPLFKWPYRSVITHFFLIGIYHFSSQ